MFGEQYITEGLNDLRRQELKQEAENHRLAQQFKTHTQPVYGSLLASVGNWMANAGDTLQQRYSQSLELAGEPSAECAPSS